MIKKLSVKNFKSIKELEIDCRRINLFIGEPNTGKSNILEVLGLLSWCGYGKDAPLREYVRFQETQNLFYDNWFGNSVEIKVMRAIRAAGAEDVMETGMRIAFAKERFDFDISPKKFRGGVSLDYSGNFLAIRGFPIPAFEFVKYYTFERQDDFQGKESSSLMPPHGSNMFAAVMANRKLRATMARFFNDLGFKLVLRPQARAFESQKQIEDEDIDVVFSYPYISISDTLQRMVFYTIAMESNENSTLVFEEPESHAFPYYTKYLGEKIAFDESNQYFIATHNPYFLLSILEKTPKDDVNVFITYFRDYQTKVKCLNDEETSELMRYDPFFNLDSFIEDEEEEQ